MNIESVMSQLNQLSNTFVMIEGILMENAHRPFLGRSTDDWQSGRCVRLIHDNLFDLLLNLLFPSVIGGGDTLFFYPATVVGRLDLDAIEGVWVLRELQSIRVDVHDEVFNLSLTEPPRP